MAEDAVVIPLPSYPHTYPPINSKKKKQQPKNKKTRKITEKKTTPKNLQPANQTKIHLTDKN